MKHKEEYKAIILFTSESIEEIIKQRGTEHWRIDKNKASKRNFVVLCRKTNKNEISNKEPHGSAFCVARLEKIEFFCEPHRKKLFLNEYTSCCVLDVWQNLAENSTLEDLSINQTTKKKWLQYPVKYSTLEECGINPKVLRKLKPLFTRK